MIFSNVRSIKNYKLYYKMRFGSNRRVTRRMKNLPDGHTCIARYNDRATRILLPKSRGGDLDAHFGWPQRPLYLPLSKYHDHRHEGTRNICDSLQHRKSARHDWFIGSCRDTDVWEKVCEGQFTVYTFNVVVHQREYLYPSYSVHRKHCNASSA